MDTAANYKATRETLFKKEGIVAESRFVETDGPVRHVHYLESGRGLPMVLIHGGGSHCMEWYPVIRQLSKKYHLFIVDRPGCGLTDPFDYAGVDVKRHAVDFLRSFLQALKLDQVVLAAHSMGAYFAFNFSIHFPGNVHMMIWPGAPAGLNRWIPPKLRLLGTRGLNKLLIRTVAKPSIRGVKEIYSDLLVKDPDRVAPEYLLNTFHGQMLPGGMKSFTTLLENVLTWKGWKEQYYMGDQLHQLTVPLRIIWGANDVFETPESGKSKVRLVRDCRFEIVKDAGHCVWLDQPGECTTLMDEMVAELKFST